jgi:uncharacterized membrane protein YkoI
MPEEGMGGGEDTATRGAGRVFYFALASSFFLSLSWLSSKCVSRARDQSQTRTGGHMKNLKSTFAGSIALLNLVASVAFAGPLEDVFYPADANGVLPIERILDLARASVAGTITEVELEHEHGRLIYEVLIVTPDNRKVEIEFDARTGAELSREVKKNKPKKED